ncbi:MAG: RNA polymerase sporulation sigma factor SigK [Candidatus Paraimprobicoccus trichonymphae]|uniref:RNA polymerase sporulation sigma factor SigK n=1 Tax=Candidatus Paraimprobicoccus trichonymphae TaxID=3033793 RepID=A0AA48HZK2_9FIRM|nr:MAG: RNA polymerase sporulation sigma factor SigK [Candidatus Paraimprobicoccus trichonymphae]
MFSFLFYILNNLIFFILHVISPNLFPKTLSNKEEQEYLKLAANGNIKAKNKLVEHNLRLVAHISKKYCSNKLDIEDLISVGTIGLIKAINTFDFKKGAKLSSYTARCIENEILMYLRSNRKTGLDISMSDAIEIDKDGNSLTILDTIKTDISIEDEISKKIDIQKLKKILISHLNSRERIIIFLRYGLNGNKNLPQREVAKKLKISRSYVSRIETKAINILKEFFIEN